MAAASQERSSHNPDCSSGRKDRNCHDESCRHRHIRHRQSTRHPDRRGDESCLGLEGEEACLGVTATLELWRKSIPTESCQLERRQLGSWLRIRRLGFRTMPEDDSCRTRRRRDERAHVLEEPSRNQDRLLLHSSFRIDSSDAL